MDKNEKPEDVEAYLAGAAAEAGPVLNAVRELIRTTLPDAEEVISWGVPFYRYRGLLGGFAVYQDHVSFGFTDEAALSGEERKKLREQGYVTGKKTLRVRFDQDLPAEAIRRILQARAHLNEAKQATE